ncbi:MAG: nicotinate-nucleotide adenylyltransferase [Desulfocapsaceae bacterium]|nr:nicotinate-nucleotide adenylyltransferase [Desulfocapsaceae bacterium]
MNRRVGLLGGTFDPVHNGHLQIAEIAKNFCDLQMVMFIPAAVPPHKNGKAVASFNHRANMIQLALEGRPGFGLSTIEASLPEPSYTIDTLRYLHSHTTVATDFFFIIGADAFLEITTWKLYKQVLEATHFVVLARTGSASSKVKDLIKTLGYEPDDSLQIWCHPSLLKKIFFPQVPLTPFADLSSSQIRQNLKDNMPVEGIVPALVLNYILAQGLYV